MSNPRTPAGQLFYGPIYGDFIAQQLAHLTGQNPYTLARMRRAHGRYLAGFGGQDITLPGTIVPGVLSPRDQAGHLVCQARSQSWDPKDGRCYSPDSGWDALSTQTKLGAAAVLGAFVGYMFGS